MNDIKSLLKAHRKTLIDIAFETLLTSHWVPHTNLPEPTCRRIFSEIFTQLEIDLFSDTSQTGYNLSRYYANAFQNRLEMKQNFYAQLTLLGISRIVINHFLIHTLEDRSAEFQGILEKIQKIFDYTLISLGQGWGQLYEDLRKKDLQLIAELQVVKNDLQRQLDVTYQIIKESPLGAADCDDQFNVLYWNPTAVRLTGYTPVDILKRNIFEVFTNASRQHLKAKLTSDRRKISNLRLYIQPKLGTPLPVLVSVSKLRYSRPGNIHYVLNFLQISDNAIGAKSKQKLNQLTTITRLTSAIMHDIRNPINSIGLNVEILEKLLQKENDRPQSDIQEFVNKIQREIQQISLNLNQYLAYGHLAELYPEPLNFSEKFRDFIEDISFEATMNKIKIQFHSKMSNAWINGDWVQLSRVFRNIFQNAIQVSKTEGEVQVFLFRRRDRVIVRVTDSGPGILPAHSKKIFEPFFTTKNSGTGLGLFISKQIVLAHNGRITHRPAKSGGTTFTVSFPFIVVEKEKSNE